MAASGFAGRWRGKTARECINARLTLWLGQADAVAGENGL